MNRERPTAVPRRFSRLTSITPALAVLVFTASTGPQVVDDIEWPRAIDVPAGRVLMYQPEPESFEGDDLSVRAAVSVTPTGADAPVFGVVWVDARLETDRDARTASVLDIDVTRVRFPDATPEQEEALATVLEAEVPEWELTLSLDQLLASLAAVELDIAAAEALGSAPPEIVFTTEPTVLVSIDGEPILQEVDGSSLMRVVNTPFTMLLATDGTYYLYAGEESWYSADAVDGQWAPSTAVPEAVASRAPAAPSDPVDVDDAEPTEPGPPPALLVATEPTELIVTDGAPAYSPISGTDLLYLSNSESDVLLEIETQRYFLVLSGRWYAAGAIAGPWSHVPPPDLPSTMAAIPPESEMGHLLLSVPGTEAAVEAALDHQIPQTSAIRRSEAQLDVTYDGEPWFEAIEDTEMEYAINTSSSVIRVGGRYYACDEGVWFTSANAEGPWLVADSIPDEIHSIPPDVPVHNVKYVYVYDSTPDVVYVGYYPGYTHSYVYGGTIVYGTGYYYTPWYGSVYYPHHSTWGWHVRYNPWYGWSYGFSYSTGPFAFGIGWGGSPGYGGYWGPVGYRGYHAGYHRGWHDGYRAGAGAGYRAGFRAGTNLDNTRNNLYDRTPNRTRNLDRAVTGDRRRPGPTVGTPNDVFSNRSGDVFRRSQEGWETRGSQQWQGAQAGGAAAARARVPDRAQLDRSLQSRNRGAARTRSFQGSRARGGGRRR